MLAVMAEVSGWRLRGVVVGGDARVRRALSGLLMAEGTIELVEEAATPSELTAAVGRDCPGVVVIDLDRRDPEPWLRAIRATRSQCPCTAVIAIGSAPMLADRVRASGADAFLTKFESPRALYDVVEGAVRSRHTRSTP